MPRHTRFGFFGIRSISILLIVAASFLSLSFYTSPTVYAAGTTYYVSPSGSDSNNGTSPQTAWQTPGPAMAATLQPGDSVLFEGGQSFLNQITLTDDISTQNNPITVSSYGTGKATIIAPTDAEGLGFISTNYVVVSNLNFQTQTPFRSFPGLSFSTYGEPNNAITVENNTFTGFQEAISISNTTDIDIQINGNDFHNNYTSISVAGDTYTPDETVRSNNINITNNDTSDSPDESDALSISGFTSGNVSNNYFKGGIKISYSKNIDFKYNEIANVPYGVYLGSSGNVIEYNYFHNVVEPLNISARFDDASNNIVRYNVFENYLVGVQLVDVSITGSNPYDYQASSNQIYNNTFYTNQSTSNHNSYYDGDITYNSTTAVGYFLDVISTNNKFYNNIISQTSGEFVNDGGANATGLSFSGNLYYTTGTPSFTIGGQTYNSLGAFRTGTNNEKNGPVTNLGLDVNPGLTNPGNGGTIGLGNNLNTLIAYLPASGSPVLGAGLDLTSSTYGSLSIGSRDFYGNTLSSPYSIGAAQASTVPSQGGGGACTNDSHSTARNSGTSVTTVTYLKVCAGVLSITAPENVILSDINVSSSETNTTGTTDPVVIQDLRGSNAGWSATATVTNFVGATDASKIIKLATQSSGGTSKFSLTPGALSLVNGDGGSITGLTDYTTAQTTTSLTSLEAGGTSNTFNLASFSTGKGAGKFQKTLNLSIDVPAYTLAQTYTATVTSSVA